MTTTTHLTQFILTNINNPEMAHIFDPFRKAMRQVIADVVTEGIADTEIDIDVEIDCDDNEGEYSPLFYRTPRPDTLCFDNCIDDLRRGTNARV